MKNIICIIIIISCIHFKVEAQTSDYDNIKKNGVYIEIYPFNRDKGVGLISLNYERAFGKKKQLLLRFGIYPVYDGEDIHIPLPIVISGITSPLKSHQFEYGIGLAPILYYDSDNSHRKLWTDGFYFLLPTMYRYQNKHGLFFRGGINWILGFGGFLLHPAIGLGYKF